MCRCFEDAATSRAELDAKRERAQVAADHSRAAEIRARYAASQHERDVLEQLRHAEHRLAVGGRHG